MGCLFLKFYGKLLGGSLEKMEIKRVVCPNSPTPPSLSTNHYLINCGPLDGDDFGEASAGAGTEGHVSLCK